MSTLPTVHQRDDATAQLTAIDEAIEHGHLKDAQTRLHKLIEYCDDIPELADIQTDAKRFLNKLGSHSEEFTAQAREQLRALLIQELTVESPARTFDALEAESYFKAYTEQIEDQLQRWNYAVRQQVQRWRTALLTDDDPAELARYCDQDIPQQEAQNRSRLLAQAVGVVCEKLWTEAERLETEEAGVRPDYLIDNYYTKAVALVRKALGNDKNSSLEVLLDEAEKKRAAKALSAQIFTSAVQGEFYRRSQNQLKSLKPNDTVPFYQFVEDEEGHRREILESYLSVAEASERLQDMAKEWAHGKALEYLNKAEELLVKEHDPSAALEELGKQKEISDFLEAVDRRDFDQLREEARKEKQRYDEAEQKAKDAKTYLLKDPLGAWKLYEEARDIYEWATEVSSARTAIIEGLEQRAEEDRAKAEEAFNRRNFDAVGRIYEQAKRDYGDKPTSVTAILDRIKDTYDRAVDLSARLDNAHERLQSIETLAATDPSSASAKFTQFEQQYKDVLGELDGLSEVRAKLASAKDADTHRRRLQSFVENDNLETVRKAVVEATAFATGTFAADPQFQKVLANLQLHETYLEAEQEFKAKLYPKALDLYKRVQVVTTHPDAGAAGSRVSQIEELIALGSNVDSKLERAESMIDAKPVDAYVLLQALDPITESQGEKIVTLSIKARNAAQPQIEKRLQKASKATLGKLSLDDVRQDLESLQRLSLNAEYDRWSQELMHLLTAQEAQQYIRQAGENALRQAVQKWREASDYALRAGKQSAFDEYQIHLRKVRKDYGRLRVEAAEAIARRENADSQSAQALIQEVQQEIDALFADYRDDIEIMLWQARLASAVAQYSYDPTRRRENFRRMLAAAQHALDMATAQNKTEMALLARQYVEQATLGQELADHMHEAQEHIRRIPHTVENMNRATQVWSRDLAKHAATPAFHVLQNWWNNQRRETIEDLRKEVAHSADQDDFLSFRPLIMILILGGDEPRAVQLVNNLDLQASALTPEVNRLVASTKTANGIYGSSGQDILQSQRHAVASLLDDLRVVIDVALLFQQDSRFDRNKLLTAEQTAQREYGKLRGQCAALLDDLDQQLNEVRDMLVNEKRTGDFQGTGMVLNDIRSTFPNHPAHVELVEARKAVIARRNWLVACLQGIRQTIEAEEYSAADRAMSARDEDELVEYGLADTFAIDDPLEERQVPGWSEVVQLVNARCGLIELVIAFAAVYDDYGNDVGSCTNGSRPTVTIVDWENSRKEIRALKDQGKFAEAHRCLNAVLKDTGIPETLALGPACEHLENPPCALDAKSGEASEPAHDTDERYRLAIEKAGTARGKRILICLRDTRLPYYRDCVTQAERVREKLSLAQHAWDKHWREWEEAMRQVAEYLDAASGLRGRIWLRFGLKGKLCQALDEAYRAYKLCECVCPQRETLKEMARASSPRRLWLYFHACQRMNHYPERASALNRNICDDANSFIF